MSDDSIYQKLPRSPNFNLIVVLSGITILVLFVVAYVFLTVDGRKLIPHTHQHADPHSLLRLDRNAVNV